MTILEIPVAEAYRSLDDFDVLDVRSRSEFEGPLGHIAGAHLLPLSEIEDRLEEIPGDAPLLVVCRSGRRSATACEWLESRRSGPTINLEGGMIAWNRAGLPSVRPSYPDSAALLEALTSWVGLVGAADAEGARRLLAELFEADGASDEAPTPEALDRMIQRLARRLRASSAPADLDLTMAVFREAITRWSPAVIAWLALG